jgi:hypothetical protein
MKALRRGYLTGMSSLALGIHVALVAGLGVHNVGALDHETVLDELADSLATVGIADLGLFVGVKPNLLVAAAEDGSGESVDCNGRNKEWISS